MHKNTFDIKNYINSQFDDSYDRVKYLKNQYKGETAYILTSGPSINDIPTDYLNEKLKDKLVLSIKQAIDKVPNITDYHLLNFCNLTKYQYQNPNTMVGWAVWDENQPNIIVQNFSCDFILDTFKLNDGSPKLENSIAFNTDQIDLLDINNSIPRPWGPGTIYELGIPLAIYLGCTKIVTVGWDLFKSSIKRYKSDEESLTQPHCYDNNSLTFKETDTSVTKKEIIQVIKSTEALHNWLQSKGIELEIVDPHGDNPAFNKIKKIKTI
jgi:hypothetical protein